VSKGGAQLIIPTGRLGRVPYPRSLAGAPLFCLSKRGSEHELATLDEVEVRIGVASNVRIRRWGAGLTAEHQDVLLAVFQKLRGLEAQLDAESNHRRRLYVETQFSAKELLDMLAKTYNKQNRDWLRRRLQELSRSHLTICASDAQPNSWPLFSGSILQLRARAKPTQGVRCSVSIPVEFVRLFQHLGYGQIDMAQRMMLGSSQLARLLQVHIECLKDRQTNTFFTYTVAKWMELTGTKSTEANFGSDLRKALKRLKDANFLTDYSVARGKVHLALPNARSKAAISRTQTSSSVPREHRPFIVRDGMRLRLGKEVPAIEEVLGEGEWSDPLPIHIYFDSQLEAMLRLYPKAYAKRPELPPLLERVRAEVLSRKSARLVGPPTASHAPTGSAGQVAALD